MSPLTFVEMTSVVRRAPIEIVLASGTKLVVPDDFDAAALSAFWPCSIVADDPVAGSDLRLHRASGHAALVRRFGTGGPRATRARSGERRALRLRQQGKGHTRRKPTGRKPLPEHLPRVEIEVLPPEVERQGLDAFERIGEDVSETVERRPASLVVARVIRPKFVRKKRERDGATEVFIAEPLELPIARGLAGPGMLADTIVKRWQDHLPLHRL